MGDNKSQDNILDGAVGSFIAKFGLVLSKVKDTMVKDFLDGLDADGLSWESFKSAGAKENFELIDKFINRIISKLGYDISSSESGELLDLVKSLVASSIKLGNCVQELVSDAEGLDLSGKGLEAARELFDEGEFKKVLDKEFKGGSLKVELALPGNAGKIKAVLDLIQEIITLVKKFSQIEWDSIARDFRNFGEFIQKSYMTEAFGKRILDYILILVLKSSKDVFMDDIKGLIEQGANVLEQAVGGQAMEDMQRIQKEISEIEGKINEARTKARAEAAMYFCQVQDNIPPILESQLAVARARLASFSSSMDFNSIARVFNKVYSILDLLGIIEERKIDLMKFVPAAIADSNVLSTSQVKILTFKWHVVKQLFTEPLDYLQSTFRIRNIGDAQIILNKILAIAKAFNDEAPGIDSPLQFLTELDARIRSRMEDHSNPLAAADISDMNDMLSLLDDRFKIFESTASVFKGVMSGAFNDFNHSDHLITEDDEGMIYEEGAEDSGILGLLKDQLDGHIKELLPEIEELKKMAVSGLSEQISQRIVEPLAMIGADKALEYFGKETSEKIKEYILQGRSGKSYDFIAEILEELCSSLENAVGKDFDAHFCNAMEMLEEKLAFLTRNVPDTTDFKFTSPSGFSTDSFLQTISSDLKDILPFNTGKFHDNVIKRSTAIITDAVTYTGNDIDAARIEAFAHEISQAWWESMQESLKEIVIQPFANLIDSDIRKWSAPVINDLLPSAKTLVSDVLKIKDAAEILENPELWKDGMKFAASLYKSIPAGIIERLNGLIELPDFDFDSIKLPEYTLDTKNRFLAVTLVNHKDKEKNFDLQIVAYAGEKPTKDGMKAGLYIIPVIKCNLLKNINIGEKHYLNISGGAALNGGEQKADNLNGKIGLFFTKGSSPFKLEVIPMADLSSIELDASLKFARGRDGKDNDNEEEIFSSEIVDLGITNYPQTFKLSYKEKKFDIGYLCEIKDFIIKLKLKELNGLFNKILDGDIVIPVDFHIGYSLQKGLDIGGGLYVSIPITKNIDLGAVKFKNNFFEFGIKDGDFLTNIKTSFNADLKCVAFSFADMGVGLSCNILGKDGGMGDFDFTPAITYPDGIGISIEVPDVVTGTGALKWNRETGEITGMAGISILGICSADAFFQLITKEKDGAPFSFLGALYVGFHPGLQIGLGFSLTAVGGSLGLNRRIDTDKLQLAVRDGSLGSIVFVTDVKDHLDEILSNLSIYYPVKKDQFFLGVMAQLTWAEIFVIDLGLFVQAPNPVTITLFGGLHMKLADAAEKLLSMNAYFMANLDPSKGFDFDAELVDTKLVGIDFYGSLALRIYWGGSTKGFLLSAGGFHPKYVPEAGFNVGQMKRIGMKLDYSILKIGLEAYFAVTSNTVQFGADARLQIGWDEFGLSGYMYFNTLFQFNPFAFMFDVGVGVAVKCGDWTLLSVSLALDVEGPAKWHIKGSASFWFILVKISIDFSETWGKSQSISDKKYVSLQTMLKDEFYNNENWSIIRSDLVDNLVSIAAYNGKEIVMNPFDNISFAQNAVPVSEDIEKYGESIPGDITRIELKDVRFGGGDIEASHTPVHSSFAPSLIHEMSKEEKLSSPSYVAMESGFSVRNAGEDLKYLNAVESELAQPDFKVQEIDALHWSKWMNDASTPAVSQKKSKKTATESAVPRNISTSSSRRPSSRRTPDGYTRYINEIDRNMNADLSDLISNLNK